MTKTSLVVRNVKRNAAVALVTCLLAAPGLARAGEAVQIEDVAFPSALRAGDADLRLHGGGKLKWLVFDVYVGALYLPDGDAASNALADVPKRLEFHYLVSIDGEDFGPAGEKILARNVSEEQLASLRDRLDRIRAAYRDVKPGDRYALTYRPGVGTELTYNGQPLATIEGEDFARAYFSIWLGRKPLDDGFRQSLLRSLPVAVTQR